MLDGRQNEIMHIFLIEAVNLEMGLDCGGSDRGTTLSNYFMFSPGL